MNLNLNYLGVAFSGTFRTTTYLVQLATGTHWNMSERADVQSSLFFENHEPAPRRFENGLLNHGDRARLRIQIQNNNALRATTLVLQMVGSLLSHNFLFLQLYLEVMSVC